MNSCELSNTGLPVAAFGVVGLVLLLVGGAALLAFGGRGRRGQRARAGGALVLLLVVGAVVGAAGGGAAAQAATEVAPPNAGAASDDCPGGDGSGDGPADPFTISQTSVNTDLKPGGGATTLAGTIIYHGAQSTYITFITVSIDSVTKAPGAAAGECDASDYVLQDVAMPVHRTLAPGEAAEFSGASIGFSDKGTNQDACKKATVHLRYVSS